MEARGETTKSKTASQQLFQPHPYQQQLHYQHLPTHSPAHNTSILYVRFHARATRHSPNQLLQCSAPHAQLHHGQQPAYASPSAQSDLLLLHVAHQSFSQWAELRHLHPSSYAGTYEQPINGGIRRHINRSYLSWSVCSSSSPRQRTRHVPILAPVTVGNDIITTGPDYSGR